MGNILLSVLPFLQGLYIFLVYAVYNSEVRNAIKRIKEKRKALSFTVSQKAYSDILTNIFMFQLEKNTMPIQ
ncbi:unnamed protein product [Oncorhynchus mykiss]|uniref:Uncharacterized protein n=1 Tax=Oncorhynchus mykiss TaxID=8022 RepID=A0A060XGR7_ONCMY|nr:unnamed protein product [Oncorhynchus mykiss]